MSEKNIQPTSASRDAKGYLSQELRKDYSETFGDRAVVTNPQIVQLIETQTNKQHDRALNNFEGIKEVRTKLIAKETAYNEQQTNLQDLKEQTKYDPLLEKQQILSRREFDARFRQALGTANRGDTDLQILEIDADRFKLVNDAYGHPVGDTLLKTLAYSLKRVFKRETDIVARYGGEELVIGLPNTSPAEAAALLLRAQNVYADVQAIMRSGERPEDFPEGEYPKDLPDQTFSAGIGSRLKNKDKDQGQGRGNESETQIMAKTDSALYKAKQTRDIVAAYVGGEKQFQVTSRHSNTPRPKSAAPTKP